MVVDVDLSALRRPLPVHKSAPEGSPETPKNQIHKFMHTNGEAAVAPPWGEFNPPPTEGVATACGIHCHIAKKLSALISHKGSIRKAKLLMMGQALDPLSFSLPRRGGMTGNRSQKAQLPYLEASRVDF